MPEISGKQYTWRLYLYIHWLEYWRRFKVLAYFHWIEWVFAAIVLALLVCLS